tara:strand:+ start:993 stop:1313 length:321 start_codon:yes stop_codon:yes gene_type:complete
MPNFIIVYHGGKTSMSPEEGQKLMASWRAWMAGMGSAVVNPGWPVGASRTINSDRSITENGGPNPISGVTVIAADSLEAATELVKPCPHLDIGGSIELAPALDMPM